MLSRLLFTVLAALLCLAAVDGKKSRFTYYPMLTPVSFPCDTVEGPDGAVWVEELIANKLARIDPKTGKVTEYNIPFTVPQLNVSTPSPFTGAISCAFAVGYDGMLYASNGLRNQLVQMNTKTKVVKVFTPPSGIAGNLQPLNDMTAAPDGIYMTSTSANIINKFHYDTHKFELIKVPTPLAIPVGIYYATDGGIWFLEFGASKVGRLNRKTKEIVEYDLPPDLAQPIVMRAETKGRYLYFACVSGNSIGEVDMQTRKFRAFKVPHPLSTPVEVCPSAAGDIWFTHILQNSLGRLRPSTGEFTEHPLPGTLNPGGPVSGPTYVGSGIYCRPGNAIWATEGTLNRAYRFQLFT